MSVDIFDPTQSGTLSNDINFAIKAFNGASPGSASTPFFVGFQEGQTLTNTVQQTVNSFRTIPYPAGTQFSVECSGPGLASPLSVGGSVLYSLASGSTF